MGSPWEGDDINRIISRAFNGKIPNLNTTKHQYSTSNILTSKSLIKQVEPGKYVKKTEKTEEIRRSRNGGPEEVVKSDKKFTEEDVTNEMTGLLGRLRNFKLPNLSDDVDAGKILKTTEEMRNETSKSFGSPGINVNEFQSPWGKRLPSIGGPSDRDKRGPSPSIPIDGPSRELASSQKDEGFFVFPNMGAVLLGLLLLYILFG